MKTYNNLLGSADNHAVTDAQIEELTEGMEGTVSKQWHNGKRVYIVNSQDKYTARKAARLIAQAANGRAGSVRTNEYGSFVTVTE